MDRCLRQRVCLLHLPLLLDLPVDGGNPETDSTDEAAVDPSSKRSKKHRSIFQRQQEQVLVGNSQTTGNEQEAEEEKGADWLEISGDILELIIARLHIGDRQTSRVCKHWRSALLRAAPKSCPVSYGNPCLFRLLDGNKRCELIDHLRGDERFVIETPSLPEDLVIVHSNDGWLLLSQRTRMHDAMLFFFNPLTQESVELPKLEYVFSCWFSSRPTSSDCVVIGAQTFTPNFTYFYHWEPGEKEWRTFRVCNYKSVTRRKPFVISDLSLQPRRKDRNL